MTTDKVNKIEISRKPSFVEEWYEGTIEYNNEEYKFWLINPVKSPDGQDYAAEVRWWFKGVPREVRMMHSYIIEGFLQTLNVN